MEDGLSCPVTLMGCCHYLRNNHLFMPRLVVKNVYWFEYRRKV
ncbi:hypothetical protein BURPS1655_B0013 [Burkholderia pseudomallei 1655]|nr:hypothetical protein BURPS1655_B0013 [Burkholderia pseudomallei 1655]